MKTKHKKRNGIVVLAFIFQCCICLPNALIAQTPPGPISIDATTASQQLSCIYRAYDSMRYVSFDIRIMMDTDTLNGQSQHSAQEGKFSVAGKKYNYTLGGNEVMQNDSFLISFYKTGKTIVLDRPKPNGASSMVSGSNGALDSIMSAYANNYDMFSDTTNDGNKLLLLHAKGVQMPYSDISIEYEPKRHYLLRSSYTFYAANYQDDNLTTTAANASSGNSTSQTMRRNTITIYYENYRFDPESFTNAFRETKFIRYDGKKYWPIQAYANYQFFDMVSK